MRIVLTIGLLIAFAVSAPTFAEESTYDSDTVSGHSENELAVYPLQKDETLSHVALSYYGSISFAALLAEYNNISDVKRIHVGQEIRIPHTILYKIKRDDVLSRISQKMLGSARKYHIIAEHNNIPDPNFIMAGQTLRIPLISLPEEPEVTPKVVEEEEPPIEEISEPEKPTEPEEKVTEPGVEEIVEPEEQEEPPVEEKEIIPEEEKEEVPTDIEEEQVPVVVEEEKTEPPAEEEKPGVEEVTPPEVEQKPEEEKKPVIPPPRTDFRLTPVEKPEKPAKIEAVPGQEKDWPPTSPWDQEEAPPEEEPVEPEHISPLLEALGRWEREIKGVDIKDVRAQRGRGGSVVELPMDSQLEVNAYKSVTIEYNKTHYFGDSDINRYRGYYSGGGYGSSYGGYDSYGSSYGSSSYGSSSYGSSYGGYGSTYGSSGYGSSYGGGYNSYAGYGGRRSGPNIEQELEVHIHGRIGRHTHIDVDYSDTARSQFGGMGQKEQEIVVWYEGDEDDIIKKASFGDIRLNLPNTRFLNMGRSLFGVELVAEVADIKFTAFGTRTKGIKGTWTSRGQSRRSGGGTGNRIMDINYIKERYYALNMGEDGLLYDSYLPIETNSEQIYIDDGIGTDNDSGIATAQGYYDYQYPGDDYNIDYATGQIEFLKNVSSAYKIVIAYKYRGEGGGAVGNPDAVFSDDDEDGVTDEADDPDDPVGYVVLKESGEHGSELRNVYSLGNRNIGRRDFDLSIWREGGTESFNTDDGPVSYAIIFGLDSDGDGLVDPELIDFEKGVLTFPKPTPFMVDDPASPYYKYRDELNNVAIYSENPRYADQKYVLQADYSYQMPSFYIGRLNILPDSEEVRVNNQTLKRGIDYIMVYEVGSVEIFRELDEYDEITIDYEYMPFGGQFQQTIAGVWAEYSYVPAFKRQPEPDREQTSPYGDDMSPFSQGMDRSRTSSGYSSGRSNYGSSYGSGSSSYGSSYGSSYSSGGGYGSSYSRRGSYGGGFDSGRRRSTRSSYGSSIREGVNLSLGYIYNTGQRTTAIPDVNSAPSRVQATVLSGSWGDKFNVARVLGLMPFISIQGEVPLSVSLDGEFAYSRNNPNSVGYAMIDSMEGAKETARIPTYKFSWQIGSIPVMSDVGASVDNRAVFHTARKDKEASYGNYMKNRETSAIEINPLSRATQQHLVMEIGYELDENASWGSLSHSLSASGADYSEYEFLEVWMKVDGDDDVNLHIDIGVVNEDSDDDFVLDSEDLPRDMIDQNGDHKVDILDLNKEDLPEEHKYKGNGNLDLREDTGWIYNDFAGTELANIGSENTVLDTEDLDGDVVLDTTNSYYEFTIPLNAIPAEWVRKETSDTGWMFLSIPLEAAVPRGRSPSWGVVKHARIWLEKNEPGLVAGRFQWYSITVAGNRWQRGLVVDETGKLSEDANDQLSIGTKNNHEFEDYQKEYEIIEHNDEFDALHPYVESAFAYEEERKEQSLTLSYELQPDSTGYTMRDLSGQRRGDGQDFSKHESLRFWIHGDGSRSVLVLKLGSNVDDFGAGSPVTTTETTEPGQFPGSYSSYYSYSSSSRYGGRGHYEYSLVIDFTGWKMITIPLTDEDDDGQPDGLEAVAESSIEPSIANVGELLVGIRNDMDLPIAGEIWINEIHLSDPYVKSGWARRLNLTTDLMNVFSIRGGYAKQDNDFENSAGQTGRASQMRMGYSTSTYDYNLDTDLNLISWLPVGYSISHRESESLSQYGMISSYQSGLTKTDNRTFSISLERSPIPSLSFAYDNQQEWNERRGLEISDLYSSDMGYSLGSIFSLKLNYSHESLEVEKNEESTTTTSSYSGYYYGSDRDSIIDRGGVSLTISPIKSFSINPTYDIRRELERELVEDSADGGDSEEKGKFSIAARDQRLSLRPTLRSFIGLKPSLGGRYSFNEDWFRGEKDASINTDFNVGLNISFKTWFTSRDKKRKAEARERGETLESKESASEETSIEDYTDYNDEDLRVLDEETRREVLDDRAQSERGNWIEREKEELKRKKPGQDDGKSGKGILRRSAESFTFNTDFRYSMNDYLRRLKPDMGFTDIIKLEQESEFRTRSTTSKRFSIRTNMDPFSWASIGGNVALTNRFTKSSGTASNSDSSTIGGNIKFLGLGGARLMLKYDMRTQDSGNRSGRISEGITHNQSITLQKNWQSGVGSSLGMRTTFRNYERGGTKTKSKIFAPNFNIDYDLHVDGSMRLPLIGKTINLDHNLDMSNTFSAMVRREELGVNRDEKSEQYGTSIDVSYRLRETIRSTLRLSVDYNHDRVEEGADFISISGALMIRGEFR